MRKSLLWALLLIALVVLILIRNSGGRMSGVGSSATFLKHFVDYPAWAHVDMAGMAFDIKDNPYIPGNERCDQLAVEASMEANLQEDEWYVKSEQLGLDMG